MFYEFFVALVTFNDNIYAEALKNLRLERAKRVSLYVDAEEFNACTHM